MNQPNQRRIVALDIDGTQLREDISQDSFSEKDLKGIRKLKFLLESLRDQGVIVVHVTNRMFDLYKRSEHLLAESDYVACAASTRLFQRTDAGLLIPEKNYEDKIKESNFDPKRCEEHANLFADALTQSGAEHQTDRKVSYHIHSDIPVTNRFHIFNQLKNMQPDGTSVFMVEDLNNHIIDFLPTICNKGNIIRHIAQIEKIPPQNVFVFGNANNDIAMFQNDFNGAAVGNATLLLREHIQSLQKNKNNSGRHIISPEINTESVLSGLQHFGFVK